MASKTNFFVQNKSGNNNNNNSNNNNNNNNNNSNNSYILQHSKPSLDLSLFLIFLPKPRLLFL